MIAYNVRYLDDYFLSEREKAVVHIILAIQPQEYNKEVDQIIYIAEDNKNKLFSISSKDISFFARSKKISKAKAMLLW